MATVVLTSSICDSIIENMLKPLKAENADLEKAFASAAQASGAAVLEYIRGAIPADMLKMFQQAGWVVKDTLTVTWACYRDGRIISDPKHDVRYDEARTVNVRYAGMPIPGKMRDHYGQSGHVTVLLGPGETTFPILYDLLHKLVDNENSQAQLKDKLSHLFEDSKTLNRLEKVWPSVTEFVTSDTLERLRRKVERTKSEPITTLDDDLQAAIISTRIQKVP